MKRNAEGSIIRKNGKWYARLRYTDAAGRPREKKRTCISHAKAKDEIKNLKAEIETESGERLRYSGADAFYRRYYVHIAKIVGGHVVSGFRQNIVSVEHYMAASLEFFGDKYLDEITYADLKKFKDEIAHRPTRTGGPRSISDINQFLKRLRRILNVAVEQGWIAVNPFKRGGPLVIESFEVERTRIVTPTEEARLIAACDKWRKHIVPVIIFAIETGCRRGEIQTLRWNAVDLTGRVVKINATNTKTLKGRLVPISQRLRDTLAKLRQNQLRPNSLVFGTGDFKRAFNTAVRDAELDDLHFHDLRHTAITRMLEKGIPQTLVMKISGHTQQKTFMRYVNQTESSIYDIALKLDLAAA